MSEPTVYAAPPAAQAPLGQDPTFFRAREFEPQFLLQKEEPHHRVICYLAAEGNTTTEIADKTGFTTATVAYVKKQPWALELIRTVQQRAGSDAVKQVLQGAAVDAAKTLVDVMSGRIEGKACDRSKAANTILDRLYGTAPQLIMHGKVDPSDLSDEELAQICQTNTQSL